MEDYYSGTSVILTAMPADGSSFAGWSGACTGTGTCTVSIISAKSVTATFNLITPPAGPVCSGADFNFDKIVNSTDFSILLFFWKTKPPFKNACVDINQDSKVDSVDFSIMLYQWGSRR